MTRKGDAPKFAVTLCNPPGYPHAVALREVAETLHWGLVGAGVESNLVENQFFEDRFNIVLAPHLLTNFPGWDSRGTGNLILFNFEQIRPELLRKLPFYPALLARCRVWDYDSGNAAALAAMGIGHVERVRIGFASQMERIPTAGAQDIDVLFYGSLTARRLKLRDELVSRGLVVQFVFGVYGQERDALIQRAKLVVNPCVYGSGGIFDIVRLAYLLTNRKAVVMESGIDPEQESIFEPGVCFASIEDMADECAYFCTVDAERDDLAGRGYALFSKMRQSALLAPAIAGIRNR